MKRKFVIFSVFTAVILILASSLIHFSIAATYTVTPQWASSVTTSPNNVTFNQVITDSSGNSYVVGTATGTGTFNFGNGVTVSAANAGNNGFLIKYNSSGVAQWASYASISPDESDFKSIALGAAGDIYVAGQISGTGTFDFGNSVTVHGAGFVYNGLVIKYNASGVAQWAYSTTTAPDINQFYSVTVDSSDNVYVAGGITGTGTYNFGNSKTVTGKFNDTNLIVLKYNVSGVTQWVSSFVSASDASLPFAIGHDSSGNTYTGGYLNGNGSFDFGNGVTVAGGTAFTANLVLVKYNTSGVAQWAKSTATSSDLSWFKSVAVAGDGTSYAVGQITGTGSYGLGNSVSVAGANASTNPVIVKYSASGVPQWADSTVIATDTSFYASVSIDTSGNSYVVGQLNGTGSYDFGGGVTVTAPGSYPPVIVGYDTSGVALWAKTVVTPNDTAQYNGISLDSSNNIYVAGYFGGVLTYDLGGGITVFGPGSSNSLIAKYTVTSSGTSTPTPTPVPSTAPGGPPSCDMPAPPKAPNIFNAIRNGTNVTLWYTPVNTNTTGYAVVYGFAPNHDLFAMSFLQGYSSGNLSVELGGLEPTQSYSFKMQAINDCAGGPWSNYLTVDAYIPYPFPIPPTSTPSATPTAAPGVTPAPVVTPTESPIGVPIAPEPIIGGGAVLGGITDAGVTTGGGLVAVAAAGQAIGMAYVVARSLPVVYTMTGRSLAYVPVDYVGGVWQGTWFLITEFFGPVFGLVRKRQGAGRVFDSANGKPISGAFVVLFSPSGNLKTNFTDAFGQYELAPKPDIYELRVDKNSYNFPSRLVTVTETVTFARVYVPGEKFDIKSKGEKFNYVSIPIDPASITAELPRAFVQALHIVSFIFSKLILVLEIAGVVVGGLAAYSIPGLTYKLIFVIIFSFAVFDIVRRIINSRSARI